MGSSLSLVIIDFFMEAFEKIALEQSPLKQRLYDITHTLMISWWNGHIRKGNC